MSYNKHKLNKHKRDYACGKELSNDLIQLIIGDLEQDYNGNKSTSQVDRGAFSAVANKYKVSVSTGRDFVSGKNQNNLSVDTDQ